MFYTVYLQFVTGIIRLGFFLALISGYASVTVYFKEKAGESVQRGMISYKSIKNHFYGKRNYNKYKDYREIMKEQGYLVK